MHTKKGKSPNLLVFKKCQISTGRETFKNGLFEYFIGYLLFNHNAEIPIYTG